MIVACQFLRHSPVNTTREIIKELHLSECDSSAKVLLVRGISDHEPMPICQTNIGLRMLHVLVLRAKVSVQYDRRHVLPASIQISQQFSVTRVRLESLRLWVVFPAFPEIDTRPWAGRA